MGTHHLFGETGGTSTEILLYYALGAGVKIPCSQQVIKLDSAELSKQTPISAEDPTCGFVK